MTTVDIEAVARRCADKAWADGADDDPRLRDPGPADYKALTDATGRLDCEPEAPVFDAAFQRRMAEHVAKRPASFDSRTNVMCIRGVNYVMTAAPEGPSFALVRTEDGVTVARYNYLLPEDTDAFIDSADIDLAKEAFFFWRSIGRPVHRGFVRAKS